MFNVENNARDRGDKIFSKASQKGLSDQQAARAARKQEAKEIKRGNVWIKKNVGLD